jgi:hypothetical protein
MASIAFRWSGLLLTIGAILLGAGIVMVSFDVGGDHPLSSPLISVSLFVASILLLLSLPAMYARQAAAAGWLGLIGHTLLEIGVLLLFSLTSLPLRFPSLNPPAHGENAVDFILGISFTIGLLLTSIATLRARVLPRGAGIVLVAGTALFFFGFFVAEVLPRVAGQVGTMLLGISLAVGFAWIGVAMVREREIPLAADSHQDSPRFAGQR